MTSKKEFYFILLNNLKEGKTLTQISQKYNVSKQKLNYYTRTLKQLGFIEKKGYGVWEVKRSKKEDLEQTINWRDKKVRGHAFIWKVKLKRNFDWKRILEEKNINYVLIRGYTPRIFIDNKKIWLGKKTITIYENKSFYGKNAIQSRRYAVYELLCSIEHLESKLGINLEKPLFTPTREHFGLIKNELARQCNKKGEKIIVRDDLDGQWLWIDDSEGMEGEFETGGKGITLDRVELNRNVQDWYNDHKKHGFKVTPSFLMESIYKITKNQMIFDANMSSHLEVLENIGKAILEFKEEIKKMKK